MSVYVIGLTGKKGAGKSTLSRNLTTLVEADQFQCATLAFATPLKMACHILFGGDASHWFGNNKEAILPHLNKTPRELMQKLGTDFCRNQISTSIWLDHMALQLEHEQDLYREDGEHRVVIIDDIRFEDEAAMLVEKFSAKIFRINVDGEDTPIDATTHASEFGIPMQYVAMNYFAARGDTASLKNIAKAIYTSIDFAG